MFRSRVALAAAVTSSSAATASSFLVRRSPVATSFLARGAGAHAWFSASSVPLAARRHWSSIPPLSESAKAFEEQELAREAAGVDNLLRCLEKEIDDEALRLDKEPPKMPAGWTVEHTPGTAFFVMRRYWNDEVHTIRATLTQRNPALDPECDLRGEHFPFNLLVEKNQKVDGAADKTDFDVYAASGGGSKVRFAPIRETCPNKTLDFLLDVVEGECVIDKVRSYDTASAAREQTPEGLFERNAMYQGPNLDESEEEVLDGFQLYLAERQIDDQMAEFIGQYSVWTEQAEYERWLKNFQGFLQA